MERFKVPADERFLLGAGPALELGLATAGRGEGPEDLDPQDIHRRIQRGSPTGLAGEVIGETLVEICG